MPHVKKHKDKKPVRPESDIILKKEMKNFGEKKIKSNPKVLSKKKKQDKAKKNSVDFHLEIIKKIDTLIAEHEKETKSEEEPEDSLEGIVEIRKPHKKKLEASDFKSDIRAENISNYLDFENEQFKVELSGKADPGFRFVRALEEPKDIVYVRDLDHLEKNDDPHSKMLGGLDKTNQKTAMGFARIKIRSREERAKILDAEKKPKHASSPQNIKNVKETNKVNGFTAVKKELEETKKEIEEKKKELELAEKRAKEEAEELKIKKKERFEKDKEGKKLKKLELKKAKIEAKEREKKLREKAKIEAKNKKLEAKAALKEEKLKRKLEAKKKVGKPEKEPASVLKAKKPDDKKKKEKDSTKGLHHFILGKKEVAEENPILDEDIIQVLRITDNLLEKLPSEVIDEFVQSEDFTLYEKVISKYKIK